MGNQNSNHKALLQSSLYAEYEAERKRFRGEQDFEPEEVCWLLYHFVSTTKELKHESTSSKKKSNKPISQSWAKYSLSDLTITKKDASNTIVFGKKLQLYPLIARRIWAVLDPTGNKISSFTAWIDALRIISYGSFSAKMSLAFRLFNKSTIVRQDVNDLFSEIGEFLSEVGMGMIDAIEFLVIKSFAWDEIFSRRQSLNERNWISCAEKYSALVAPFDVLNVVLGQDIRRMDESLQTPQVFGQSINKIAFGYSSDFTGSRVLVPEILLTACRFFETANIEDHPNLFDTRCALTMAAEMKEQMDRGIPLKRILLNANKDINRLHYYAVGTLLKDFCGQIPRPIFGFQACGRLVETHQRKLSESETLIIYISIFTEMETLSKVFFQVLISFFRKLPLTERKKICQLFSRSRIFRYSDGSNLKSKQYCGDLEEILNFMISHAEHFIAIPVGEMVNPWTRISELEKQIAELQQLRNTSGVQGKAVPIQWGNAAADTTEEGKLKKIPSAFELPSMFEAPKLTSSNSRPSVKSLWESH